MCQARRFDAVVIGGGPAGATAALRAARRGLHVAMLERDRHPRFHIGESFLPRQTALLSELGLLEGVRALPHVPKFGASFAMADDDASTDFWFSPGPRGEAPETLSMARAPFDEFLYETARAAGVTVIDGCGVRAITSLSETGAVLQTDAGEMSARVLLDASGHGTVVGRHLRTRVTLPDLCRVAYYQHFTGVDRRPGPIGGHPIIVMADEGWFWMIPLDEQRTSVGVVMDHAIARSIGVPPESMLSWAIERSPFVRARMSLACGADCNHTCADFSYTCAPFAGPGYFLVGDAATFVDPIFSTGVCMGMMSAVKAADAAADIVLEGHHAARLRDVYDRYVQGSSSVFFGLVRRYYRHGFREMFLNGTGPLNVHKAILSLLAGHVFPRPVHALRWRLQLFEALLAVHERLVPLVPKRPRASLMKTEPVAFAGARECVPC